MGNTKTTQGKKLYKESELPKHRIDSKDISKQISTAGLRAFVFGPVYTAISNRIKNLRADENGLRKDPSGRIEHGLQEILDFTAKLDEKTQQHLPWFCEAVLTKFGYSHEDAKSIGEKLAYDLTHYGKHGIDSGQNYLETAAPFVGAASATNVGVGTREAFGKLKNYSTLASQDNLSISNELQNTSTSIKKRF